MLVVVSVSVVVTALAACPAPDLFELPYAALPERDVDAGPPEPDATCAGDDACASFECELLDVDCADGFTCARDGLCTPSCFEPDPDCSRLADGFRCNFGEECASLRCVAIDGNGTCVSPCAADGGCAFGARCVGIDDDDDDDDDGDTLGERVCVPGGC